MLLSVLYIIGITAEGITGALAAGREKMDIFGVIIIACVTAIGGGSVRDVLLGHYPLGIALTCSSIWLGITRFRFPRARRRNK